MLDTIQRLPKKPANHHFLNANPSAAGTQKSKEVSTSTFLLVILTRKRFIDDAFSMDNE